MVILKYLVGNIEIFSGPPSCLCSKPEQCEINGENELEVVPYVAEVTMKILLSDISF